MDSRELGQVAYDSFWRNAGKPGVPVTLWLYLPEDVRSAWRAVAVAIAERLGAMRPHVIVSIAAMDGDTYEAYRQDIANSVKAEIESQPVRKKGSNGN